MVDMANTDSERSLGLGKGKVELRAYDPRWADLGDAERRKVTTVLQELAKDVQHVGSTAIPGLASKPILDIAVALRPDADGGEIRRRMTQAGYDYQGDQGPDGGLLFVRSKDGVRTVHVHMVDENDPEWDRYLVFRDYLRKRPDRRSEYEELKRRLAASFPTDRDAYTNGKGRFVKETLQLSRRLYEDRLLDELERKPRDC